MYFNKNIFSGIPPVTLNLLIINIAIFFVCALSPTVNAVLEHRLASYFWLSPSFAIWQPVTYMFMHANITHILFNMFALLIFGRIIEKSMGSGRFLFYYLSCGVFAWVVQTGVFAGIIHHLASAFDDPAAMVDQIARASYRDALGLIWQYGGPVGDIWLYINTPMVGASGAVYGVLLAFAFLYPNAPVYLFFVPVPIKAKWLVSGYFVLELVLGISGGTRDVAHFAHLGGMIAGILILIYWKRKGVFSNHWFF